MQHGKIYDNITELIGNTPMVRLRKVTSGGAEVVVKLEAFNPLSSVKDRLAIAIIEDAERRGTIKPGQTVIEATSGNTGIALAMVCAAKGYPFVATMADSFSVERRKIMRMLGAKVVLTPAAERGSGMVRKAEELAKKNGIAVKVGRFPFLANGRALANDQSQGFAKVLADPKTDRFLGAQIVGFGASELIAETVTVLEFGGSAEDLGRTVHAHPTMSEAVKEAALAVHNLAFSIPPR